MMGSSWENRKGQKIDPPLAKIGRALSGWRYLNLASSSAISFLGSKSILVPRCKGQRQVQQPWCMPGVFLFLHVVFVQFSARHIPLRCHY